VIEDMLRMYVMDKPSKWEYYFHLVEFSYNNGYQTSLNMSPFEVTIWEKVQHASELEKPNRKSGGWTRVTQGNGRTDGEDKKNLKATQDRKKIYADKVRTHREFKVGDHVFLKVKAKRISLKLGNYAKLVARYCELIGM
jgi:hypothetical protein